MKLPPPIRSYFDADQTEGGEPPIAAFADDAEVLDEGGKHVGHAAIEAWWHATKAEYQHRSDPREFSQAGDLATVRAEVSGKFPGSPIMFTFKFKLAGARIATLEVGV
jgi:hypothetical protein